MGAAFSHGVEMGRSRAMANTGELPNQTEEWLTVADKFFLDASNNGAKTLQLDVFFRPNFLKVLSQNRPGLRPAPGQTLPTATGTLRRHRTRRKPPGQLMLLAKKQKKKKKNQCISVDQPTEKKKKKIDVVIIIIKKKKE